MLNMKGCFFVLVLLILPLINVSAQAVSIDWDVTIGGTIDDYPYSIVKSDDGGYLIGGTSFSDKGEDKSQSSRGGFDFWVVKIDSLGVKLWDSTYGGESDDKLFSIIVTNDGGFLLGGYSSSDSFGEKSQNSKGFDDYWVVKIDKNGSKLWDVTLGGSNADFMLSMVQTKSGGFLVAGHSFSAVSGDKTSASKGARDFWVVKLDKNGIKEWDASYGGSDDEILCSLIVTDDNGFLLGGTTNSPISGDVSIASKGRRDFWIVKIDSVGNIKWDKRFGGESDETLNSVIQTSDNGFLLGGSSFSNKSGDVSNNSIGSDDFWIVKTDFNGVKQWDKRYGGTFGDVIFSLHQTEDEGYILGGKSESPHFTGDKSTPLRGSVDYWILKIDNSGSKIWDIGFGGVLANFFTAMCVNNNEDIIACGYSNSPKSGDKTQDSKSGSDFWIVKLKQVATSLYSNSIHDFKIYPNPTESFIYFKTDTFYPKSAIVYNSFGQIVIQKHFDINPIDIKYLIPGNYIIEFSDGVTSRFGQFIKN